MRGDQDRPITVAALAGMIDRSIREGLPVKVSVEGEVSGFRERTHWYFDLKDADAVVSCVVFASAARRLARIADGEQVLVTGRVEFYAKAGRVSLIATSVRRSGEGEQDAAFRRLLEEIRALGWLDPERKRPLPAFPQRVGVVTSRSAAALQDVLDTLARRCPMISVVLADARVQGEAAAPEVADRIRRLSERSSELGIDAIIVTRGGGSAEDLAAFNDKGIAQAIVDSTVPVVAAVGHETDTTIAELVADVRAATPTQAAVLVSPDTQALSEQLDSHARRLAFAARRSLRACRERLGRAEAASKGRVALRQIESQRRRLDSAARGLRHALGATLRTRGRTLDRLQLRLGDLRPDRSLAQRAIRQAGELARARARLEAAMRARREAARRRLGSAARELQAVGPMEVLSRGYSVTLTDDGSVLRTIRDARPGARIETRLADGSVRSTVGGTPDRTRAPARTRGTPGRGQLDLFPRPE